MPRRFIAFFALVAFSLVVAACNGDADPVTTSTLVQPSTTATAEPPFDPGAWAATFLVGVESEGAFADETPAGFGSGVVVDEDGLIVVPATAVVGADRVNVTVAGEEFPLEGSVEAMAECSNLALVSVDHRFPDAVTFGISPGSATWLAWVRDGEWVTATPSVANPWPFAVAIDADGEIVSLAIYEGKGVAADDAGVVVDAMRRRDVVAELNFAGLDKPDGTVVVTGVSKGSDVGIANLDAGDIITQVGTSPLTGGLAELWQAYPASTTSLEFLRAGSRYEGEVGTEAFHPASWRNVDELKEAVVRIDTSSGPGSGFFVSPDGLVVTNYHVVAGDTEVGITWDTGERTARGRVVGRSSCADLAVIDVDGTNHTFLEWSGAPIVVAQEVRSVGFPLGTNQLTFKPGEISKEQIDPSISTPVTRVFEHSAQIIGGSSGGPVVNENGEVVGVTFASRAVVERAAQEPLAITASDAAEYVSKLVEGDLEHLGARLRYFHDEDGLLLFVDVLAVDPESLADRVGIFGHPTDGDVFRRFGGLVAPHDLAIRAMCQEMEETSGPIPIAVYRYIEGQDYDGELRGRPLEIVPDPFFVVSPDQVVGTSVPGRWTGYSQLAPDDTVDFYGFRAGLPGFDFQSNFGREQYMRLLVSLDLADQSTTTERLEAEDYSGHCRDREIRPASNGSLDGHVQIWSDCSRGFEFRSYALLDPGQEPSPMVLLLVVDEGFIVDRTARRALDDLIVRPFPPSEVEESEG